MATFWRPRGRFSSRCSWTDWTAGLRGSRARQASSARSTTVFPTWCRSAWLPRSSRTKWGVERLAEYGAIWGRLGWLAAFLYVAAAAFRLARFNSNVAQDRRFFQGLASPAAAAGVAAHRVAGYALRDRGAHGTGCGNHGDRRCRSADDVAVAYLSFKDVSAENGCGSRLAADPARDHRDRDRAASDDLRSVSFIYASSGPAAWLWRRRKRHSGATSA